MSGILPLKEQRWQNGWKQANYETTPLFTGRSDISVRKCIMFNVVHRQSFTLNTTGSESGKSFQIHCLACSETGIFTAKVSLVEIEMYCTIDPVCLFKMVQHYNLRQCVLSSKWDKFIFCAAAFVPSGRETIKLEGSAGSRAWHMWREWAARRKGLATAQISASAFCAGPVLGSRRPQYCGTNFL